MRNSIRRVIERMLPWFDPIVERQRDRHTEAIRLRSIKTRKTAERIISEYELADAEAHVQHKRLVAKVRRDINQ